MPGTGDIRSDDLGVAVACDERGLVVEILRDDLGLLAGKPEHLGQVVVPSARPKLGSLLEAAVCLQPAFDWPMDVTVDGRVETLHFGAAYAGGRILVIAARDRGTLARLHQAPASHGHSDADVAIYGDLARLNNELATAERRLIKTNLQLDRANRELRALYESLPVGIFRADATGRIEQANRRFGALTGVAAPEDWLGHVHGEDAEAVGRSWREMILRGVAFESVHRQSIDGHSPRHVKMQAVSLKDTSDNPAGIVGVVEDVSEQLRAEEQQREIERREAVAELTGGLAHNLNNIMMVVLSSAERLCEDLPPAHELQAVAHRNMVAAERAAELTRRLVIYAGHGGLVFGRVEVDPAVEAIGRDLRATLAARYELILKLGAPGLAIKINRILLTETLQELVSNAKAAMPEGGRIELATAPGTDAETPDRRLVVISVKDRGVGMDAKTLRRAREPFYTTREIGKGVGLGLSLADGAARIADGVLKIRTRPGRGTVVELRLPIVE